MTASPKTPSKPEPPHERVAPVAATDVRPLKGLQPFIRPYRRHVIGAGVFLLLAALSTLAVPWALRDLIDQGFMHPGQSGKLVALRSHFLVLAGVGAALGLFSALRYYTVSWLGEHITADLKRAVYSHILTLSPEFFESTPTGEVLSRLSADTTLVQTVVSTSLSMGLRNVLMAAGALIMLIVTNPLIMVEVLGLLVLVVLPAVSYGRRVRKLSRASQDRLADSSALAAEVLNAIPVVQSYTQELGEARRFDEATHQALRVSVRRIRARAVLVGFVISATFAALMWALYQGTQAVLKGQISAGHLGQTVFYIIIFVGSIAALAEVWGDLLRAAGATERLLELLQARSSILALPHARALPMLPGGTRVELRDVTLRYPSRPNTAALAHFSLLIQPGETVALVGPSGAGKSSVFQLLLRFYDADQGAVLVNDVDVRELKLHSLRERIGLVAQDSVIFSSTAMDNIRYGRPDATDAQVIEAARAAHADEFLRALPDGYQTHLGERGVRLSGGQRQRISIARAILKNAPLLLLDEATSALDSESERAVQAALTRAMKGRTTVVIAHRLSTVINADRIAVLDQGRLLDVGRHEELLQRCGLYAKLAAQQFELQQDGVIPEASSPDLNDSPGV